MSSPFEVVVPAFWLICELLKVDVAVDQSKVMMKQRLDMRQSKYLESLRERVTERLKIA